MDATPKIVPVDFSQQPIIIVVQPDSEWTPVREERANLLMYAAAFLFGFYVLGPIFTRIIEARRK